MRLQFGVELKRQGGRKASNLDVPILASLYAKPLRKSGRKHEMAEGCYRLASEAKTETDRLSQERRSRLTRRSWCSLTLLLPYENSTLPGRTRVSISRMSPLS
jgi:hypothetical protein